MLQEPIAIKNPIIKFSFAIANVADSQTATAVPILGAVVNTHVLPFAGYIVGYGINKSAANSAGVLDFDLTINGTSTLTINAPTGNVYRALNVPEEPFAAGSTLGVTYTSDANLEANTVDVVVDVYVVFRDFDF